MNEEQFTIHDEKELFEELSKDKHKRSDILINLNVALQKYQNIVANIKGIREIQEYKIAVVTIENELQKVQQKNQQLKEQLNKYTDPKDLTLMFMYCDEKAKDKIKCLEQENQQLKEQLELSEKARKEAIELINNINDWEICSKYDCMYKDDVLDVLRMLDIDKGE